MNGRLKNNFNSSKEINLNMKLSSKNHETFYKTNNISLDFSSSPIKNNKKVIKRNIRRSSYNSFLFNKTDNIFINKNPFNSKIVSADSNNKINLKKNLFIFSNNKYSFCNNSKTKNNNIKKINKSKQNQKLKTKAKNMTAHQSSSNLEQFNININTDIFNNFLDINNYNEFSNCNTNPNIPQFILNKKKNKKQNNHSHFQHSNLLNSNVFNNYYFPKQEKANKEKDKLYFRNKNNTSKNLLFLTNLNPKKCQDKNKTSIYKNSNHKLQLNEQLFNINKKGIFRNLNSNSKLKKSKNITTKTTKNSEDKNKNKLNMNKDRMKNFINNNLTNLELSIDELGMNEFELLYNCLKKRNETYENSMKNKKYNSLGYNIMSPESLLSIIIENKKIKQKNEELSQQFENIKNEFEKMKKDNKDIKEELKEKTKYLKDIKLTMDIFSQELLKLQNIYKDNFNYNKNINSKENNDNNDIENQKYINEINNNTNNDDIGINDTNNNNNSKKNVNHVIINLANTDNNNSHKTDLNNDNIKLEKIHQLSLNNINNLINQQNKKKLGSHEANNFQDTSKIINNETKDATDKENEYLNEKWPSPLYKEKGMENDKNNNEIESKEISEESIDLTNISLAENLNINQEVYNNTINLTKKNSNISKLDIQNKLNKKKLDLNDKLNNISKKVNLINQTITNDNFNEEFLKNYDKFSDSWRKEVDKMLKKGKEKQ